MGIQPVLKPAPAQSYDLTRRQFLQATLTGAAGLVLLRTDLRQRVTSPWLIRPPGVTDEAAFLAKCLRCTECLKVCPTTALQTALGEAGLEGLWTPLVMPRVGYCDYGCTACGQVCPSGAIPLLELAEKRETLIGVAAIDRNRCLPWAYETMCIVCEEMCPRSPKAIRLEEVQITASDGTQRLLQRPYVLRDACIGCGICENQCPLEGQSAIRVYRRNG
jgi:ferredoxin